MLELHQFFNGVARSFPIYKHGRRKGDRYLKCSAKKLFS